MYCPCGSLTRISVKPLANFWHAIYSNAIAQSRHCPSLPHLQTGSKAKGEVIYFSLEDESILVSLRISKDPPQMRGICEGEIMHDQHDSLLCWEDWSGEFCGNILKINKYSDSRLNIDMEKTLLIRNFWNWNKVNKNFLCDNSMVCKYMQCLMELCYVWGYQPQRSVGLQTSNVFFPKIYQILLCSFFCWINLEKWRNKIF